MNFKILSLIALSMFLLSTASAVVVYAEFDDGNNYATGESVEFSVDFFSMNPPMMLEVSMYRESTQIDSWSISTNSRTYSYTNFYIPSQSDIGKEFRIIATGSDKISTDSYEIKFIVNNAPVLASIGDRTINENSLLQFSISATDEDTGDSLTFSASNLPNGASFNPPTKQFSWTPSSSQSGSYQVTFTVNDNHGGTDFETITIIVNDVSSTDNEDPSISIPNQQVTEGKEYSYQVHATDPDTTDTLTYDFIVAPEWLSITSAGKITGTAPYVSSNTQFYVTVEVSDGHNHFVRGEYILTVKNVALKATGGSSRTLSDPDIYYQNRYFDQYNPDAVIYSKPTTQKILGLDVLVFFYVLIALISIGIVIMVFLLGRNLRK